MKLRVFTISVFLITLLAAPALAKPLRQNLTKNKAGVSESMSKERSSLGSKLKHNMSSISDKDLRGWKRLYQLLIREEGFVPSELAAIFRDERMPRRKDLLFSVDPKESRYPYKKRLTKNERKNALKFYKEHWYFFRQAARQYRVPESIILSILQIETRCGGYTGTKRVFHRLARLANAAHPANIRRSYNKHRKSDKTIRTSDVKNRAKYLQDTFLPHVAATIKIARKNNLHPLEIRGSSAGALGLPQFLPGNYFTYGVDGDGNGSVDLFNPGDAVFSIGNFLRGHGWQNRNMSQAAKEKVIWHYNRSQPYIDTVLKKAQHLAPGIRRIQEEIRKEILSRPSPRLTPAGFSAPHTGPIRIFN